MASARTRTGTARHEFRVGVGRKDEVGTREVCREVVGQHQCTIEALAGQQSQSLARLLAVPHEDQRLDRLRLRLARQR